MQLPICKKSNVGPVLPRFEGLHVFFLFRTATAPLFDPKIGNFPLGLERRCWVSKERRCPKPDARKSAQACSRIPSRYGRASITPHWKMSSRFSARRPFRRTTITDGFWFEGFLSPSLHHKPGINYLLTFATLPC